MWKNSCIKPATIPFQTFDPEIINFEKRSTRIGDLYLQNKITYKTSYTPFLENFEKIWKFDPQNLLFIVF